MTDQTRLDDSRFYMWRAIVAMVHADGVVTPHEIHFVRESMKDLPLNADQRAIMTRDLVNAQNIYLMFSRISEKQDKRDFFAIARVLCWSDGDFQKQEQAILSMLERIHSDDDTHDLLEQSQQDVQEIFLDDESTKKEESKFSQLLKFLKRK